MREPESTSEATPAAKTVHRIAMWSGPRNISTAMMRSFGNRPDTVVCDEPFYAHYLLETGIEHPGRDEIITHHEADPARVVSALLADLPGKKSVFYQKHMAQHMIPSVDRSWFARVDHAFLIRDPLEVLISFTRKFPSVEVRDTGLPQQLEIFRTVQGATGRTPPVVDSRDVLDDPRGILAALCDALGVPFEDSMLSWPPGPRETDGVWAPHWYPEVEKTTSFQPPRPRVTEVPDNLRAVLEGCREPYEELHAHRIRV